MLKGQLTLLELLGDGLEFTRALGVLAATFALPGVNPESCLCWLAPGQPSSISAGPCPYAKYNPYRLR